MKEKLIISGLIFLLGFAAGLLTPPSCGNGSTFEKIAKSITRSDSTSAAVALPPEIIASKKPAKVVRKIAKDTAETVKQFAAVDSAFKNLNMLGAAETWRDTLASKQGDTVIVDVDALNHSIVAEFRKTETQTTVTKTLQLPIQNEPAFYEKAWFGAAVGTTGTLIIVWVVKEIIDAKNSN